MTPHSCQIARTLLGWTVEELAADSGIDASTIASFESEHLSLVRAGPQLLRDSLMDAGAIFLEPIRESGSRARLTRSAEALRDIVSIGELQDSAASLLEKAKERVERYREDSAKVHRKLDGRRREVAYRVKEDCRKLRDRVDSEVARRVRLGRRDAGMREFLETV